jgi:hypothetical protein
MCRSGIWERRPSGCVPEQLGEEVPQERFPDLLFATHGELIMKFNHEGITCFVIT